ncbi:RluA family pseudouridine synthase [Anaerotruncus sp.]|uniref:RluA family pseudouridine synthase n=1 Tax=Anaerotruncus TaxID=244127 RepID=UPI00216F25AF|nr:MULTISPECIES: RluA family pseudouridine synthase [Anaerotruncus]MCI8492804.1 RluA family pseudouridine synthase [Anaerotruncus sp.]
MNRLCYTSEESDAGARADRWLADAAAGLLTRSAIQKLCDCKAVRVGEKTVSKNDRLRGGETFTIDVPDAQPLDIAPQDIPIEIVYEDGDLLVVNKPKGMVVHPAPGHPNGTLVNALLYHCQGRLSSINGVIRPGIVHRIDKDTSGLLIVAKNDAAHGALAEQIRTHSFTRIYNAVVYGGFSADEGTIDAPIGRSQNDRKKMCVTDKNAREAVTHYQVLERLGRFTWLKLRLETGRTHQIRVHMAYIGHPVAGDPVYGPQKAITSLHGQCLHARVIGFHHPRTGAYMELSSELPDYFSVFLTSLRP